MTEIHSPETLAFIEDLIQRGIKDSLESSKRLVAKTRTSTTLASLAHAYEMAGDTLHAAATAKEALDLCAKNPGLDPVSARLCKDILHRANIYVQQKHQKSDSLTEDLASTL